MHSSGLDHSACAALEGEAQAECIASLALERAGELVGNATAQAANWKGKP